MSLWKGIIVIHALGPRFGGDPRHETASASPLPNQNPVARASEAASTADVTRNDVVVTILFFFFFFFVFCFPVPLQSTVIFHEGVHFPLQDSSFKLLPASWIRRTRWQGARELEGEVAPFQVGEKGQSRRRVKQAKIEIKFGLLTLWLKIALCLDWIPMSFSGTLGLSPALRLVRSVCDRGIFWFLVCAKP